MTISSILASKKQFKIIFFEAPYMQLSYFPHVLCQAISHSSFLIGKGGCQRANYFKRTAKS